MKSSYISLRDIFQIWRFVVPTVLFQAIGGILGVAIGYYHFWFMNMWIGGALGMLPGMLVGAAWHHFAAPNRAQSIHAVRLLACIGGAIILMAVFGAIPRMSGEMRRIADVSQLDPSEITQIEVFDEYGKTLLLTVTDPALIAEFALSVSDANGYAPGHDHCTQSWYVVVSGNARREYELDFCESRPEAVIGGFVSKNGHSTRHYGSFISQNLRIWVDHNLI